MKFLKEKWFKDSEFRNYFFRFFAIYIGLIVIEYLIASPIIGLLGSMTVLIFLGLFGKVVYKNKEQLQPKAIKSFWVFVSIFLIMSLFRGDIINILSLDVGTALIWFYAIVIAFWLYFFWFWGRESSLPKEGFAYVAATSTYMILSSLVVLAFLFLNILR